MIEHVEQPTGRDMENHVFERYASFRFERLAFVIIPIELRHRCMIHTMCAFWKQPEERFVWCRNDRPRDHAGASGVGAAGVAEGHERVEDFLYPRRLGVPEALKDSPVNGTSAPVFRLRNDS